MPGSRVASGAQGVHSWSSWMGATLEHPPSVCSRCGAIHRLSSLFEPPGECMERQVDELPVVRCPGCNRPMAPQARAPVTNGLVDIRYVWDVCGMQTKRTVGEGTKGAGRGNAVGGAR